MKFPTFAFHKEEAPEGRLVQNQEDLDALGPEWVETPAAFDPNYKRPAPAVADGTVPQEMAARGFVPQPYPAHRYTKGGAQSCLVTGVEEDAALDPDVWKDTPDPRAWDDPEYYAKRRAVVVPFAPQAAPTGASTPPPSTPPVVTSTAPSTPTGGADQADAERKAAEDLAAHAREMHALTIGDIQAKLEGCTDKAFLQKVKQMEMLNPDGPRVSLVRYLDGAIKAIDAAANS